MFQVQKVGNYLNECEKDETVKTSNMKGLNHELQESSSEEEYSRTKDISPSYSDLEAVQEEEISDIIDETLAKSQVKMMKMR